MAVAIFGVPALSCGIPLPIHHGFFSCAAAATGINAGANEAAPAPLKKFLREKVDDMLDTPLDIKPNHLRPKNGGYEFFHKRNSGVQMRC
jgi:hypothetical protein